MKKNIKKLALVLFIVLVSFGLSWAGTITVNCSHQTLQTAINKAKTGETINVTGTCNENVIIPEGTNELILDGQNTATINGPSASSPTVWVLGRGITIQNFTITGGLQGIGIFQGGTATINHNDISGAASAAQGALTVAETSQAIVLNNNIHDNPGYGIIISDNSNARIGFILTTDASASPNIIQNNGAYGIGVGRGSSARIAGNNISNNSSYGIVVFRLSAADIADNTINANGGGGIQVGANSFITLGEDNPTAFWQQPNVTTTNNSGYGLVCVLGSVIYGHLGSTNPIMGNSGPSSIDVSCPNKLMTP